MIQLVPSPFTPSVALHSVAGGMYGIVGGDGGSLDLMGLWEV